MAANRDEEVVSATRGRRPPRRWTKWLWWAILVFLLAGGLHFASLRHHWRAEFHKRVEAIHAAGYPVTGEELDAWYPWPQAGENAAFWITGAATLQQKLDQEDWKPLEPLVGRGSERQPPAEPLSADLKKLLEQFLQGNSKALGSLHDAAAIPECRYPMDLSQGPYVLMTHLPDVREGCRLLCLEAVLHAENKDPNGTAKAIEAVLHVAQSLDKEPVMISHLVRMAGANVAGVALERALNQIEFTDGQLAGLQKAFCDVRASDGSLRALAGTRCLYLTAFERPQALDRQSFDHLPPMPLLEVYDALGLSAREGTIFLDYVDECIQIVQLPTFERSAAIGAAEARVRARRGLFLREIGYMSFLIRREMQELAWIELAATAVAMERYRLARGSLPETLDQLAPAGLAVVSQDPFDGAPLRYRRLDRGFVIYSVGEDGKDDGGKEELHKKQGETYDLVFRVERPFVVTP
jgi:hypothetical protein